LRLPVNGPIESFTKQILQRVVEVSARPQSKAGDHHRFIDAKRPIVLTFELVVATMAFIL
jgi:hypothetical protein